MNKASLMATLLAPALALATPARAERLQFDHVWNPDIAAAMDSGNADLVLFDDSNPSYVFDRIVVHGTSQTNWSEALEIVTRPRKGAVASVDVWLSEIAAQGQPACHADVAILERSAGSITFSRTAPGCDGVAPYALYRLVEGKRSLFLLSAVSKAPLGETERGQWLKVLASARIEK